MENYNAVNGIITAIDPGRLLFSFVYLLTGILEVTFGI